MHRALLRCEFIVNLHAYTQSGLPHPLRPPDRQHAQRRDGLADFSDAASAGPEDHRRTGQGRAGGFRDAAGDPRALRRGHRGHGRLLPTVQPDDPRQERGAVRRGLPPARAQVHRVRALREAVVDDAPHRRRRGQGRPRAGPAPFGKAHEQRGDDVPAQPRQARHARGAGQERPDRDRQRTVPRDPALAPAAHRRAGHDRPAARRSPRRVHSPTPAE